MDDLLFLGIIVTVSLHVYRYKLLWLDFLSICIESDIDSLDPCNSTFDFFIDSVIDLILRDRRDDHLCAFRECAFIVSDLDDHAAD